ncbi:MAG: hypothetical protein AAF907_02990 [Planctomycetota bacterium]
MSAAEADHPSDQYPANRFPASRTPARSGLRAAVFAVAAALIGLEALWAGVDWPRSVSDTPALRAYYLHGAEESGPNAVALLGASRMRQGFDTRVFYERYPDRPLFHLANGPSVAVLERLADAGFSGTVLYSFRSDYATDRAVAASEEELESLLSHGSFERLAGRATAWRQWSVRALQYRLGWSGLIEQILRQRGLPRLPASVVRQDRFNPVDRVRQASYGELKSAAPPLGPDRTPDRSGLSADRLRHLERVRTAVTAVQARGGRVVFIRFPTDDDHLLWDDLNQPRDLHWDRFADLTGAVTIHFQDVPGLSGFECPDDSHLDRRDAPLFTAALLDELELRGVL